MGPSRCLYLVWTLPPLCCSPPAPTSPDARLSWARSAQIRTKPISLKLWWWTAQESDFVWIQLHFNLNPVPLYLLEETGASLWSFALWEECSTAQLLDICVWCFLFSRCFFFSFSEKYRLVAKLFLFPPPLRLMSISTSLTQTVEIWGKSMSGIMREHDLTKPGGFVSVIFFCTSVRLI